MHDLALNPYFFNGMSLFVVMCAIVLLAVLLVGPPRYRCGVCAATYDDFGSLFTHEQQHQVMPCGCRGRIHHPSCPARQASEAARRDVA